MSEFLTPLIDEDIDCKYYRLHEDLKYRSDILKCIVTVSAGFVYDHESVPIIKGTSNRGGCIHDYLCRIDSVPIVTKGLAADIYFEAMECVDKAKGDSFDRWWRRSIKSTWVKYWPSKFFHLRLVNATYEEIIGTE
jgi:hypothetical protein